MYIGTVKCSGNALTMTDDAMVVPVLGTAPTAVDAPAADGAAPAAASYFSTDGAAHAQPIAGVNIVRQGAQVRKELR